MSLDILVDLTLQITINFDILTDYISNMSSEDFRNICIGIASLKKAWSKKSA
ncbi:hypothetical protein [Psychrobium sp. 1_MG-2023]|uniref:hypothetical protein n=1 Tax=Psychrobium sp. 1_MG-2023 TaxID=3062624 RepID=UPI0026847EB5|nr:hypothetical protein [Psychrobium sp. 1_MG-2023]MDP2560882.1 hypothetical protein [Psychrobium sp. 1_MG-2023]